MGVLIWVVGLASLSGGCVATAECDAYVGCGQGEVCFLRQCLPRCEESQDCQLGEQCEPCLREGESGEGRCQGEIARVCREGGDDGE